MRTAESFVNTPSLVVCLIVALIASPASGGAQAEDDTDAWRGVPELTAWIDSHLNACWNRDGVVPAEPAGDAEWLRRVYLDLAGVIPPVWEVRKFLADEDPQRYERLVDHLLASPAHATHFATTWRKALLPEAETNPNLRFVVPGTQQWIRNQYAAGRAYDELVRDILTYELSPDGAPRNVFDPRGEASPLGFYAVKGSRPENLAASTARLFLGVRLECAQCHDHPFADWKQQEFWQLAAFYASLTRQDESNDFSPIQEDKSIRQITIAGTEQVVPALFLDGSQPDWNDEDSGPRTVLAAWVTSPENPYFARAAVNRLWAQLFGTGLVDPVDDFDPSNAASHPELLDRLAEEFVNHAFDQRFILRTLVTSRAYRLTSRVSHSSQEDLRAFAVMPVRGLAPEQLFDSLARAIGTPAADNDGAGYYNIASVRARFLETFKNQADKSTDHETSILQALALMNGPTIAQATSLDNSRTLSAIAAYPGLDPAAQVETLFLATLSRKPREDELTRLVPYVAQGGASKDSEQALSDVFWVLLNSSEFAFNH